MPAAIAKRVIERVPLGVEDVECPRLSGRLPGCHAEGHLDERQSASGLTTVISQEKSR